MNLWVLRIIRLFNDNVVKNITNNNEDIFWLQMLEQLNQGFRPQSGKIFILFKDSHPHTMGEFHMSLNRYACGMCSGT